MAAATLAMLMTFDVMAATYYVRKTGSNKNTGLSTSSAFRTIGKAASTATAGDTIYVGAGTYGGPIGPKNDGTAANPIRYIADTTGSYTGDAGAVIISKAGKSALTINSDDFNEFHGFRLTGKDVVTWTNSSGGVLQDCLIYSATDDCIDVNSSTLTVRGCTIYGAADDGVECKSNATVTLINCSIYSNTGNAIECSASNAIVSATECRLSSSARGVDVQGATVTLINCLVTDNLGDGVLIGSGSPAFTAWHCTVNGNAGDGIDQDGGTAIIKNCIVTSNIESGIERSSGTSTRANNSLYANVGSAFNGTSAATGELTTDPLYVSASDLRLQATSPAINSGASGSGITSIDYLGVARPSGGGWDRGCYEYSGAVPLRHLVIWQEVESN